MMKCKIYVFSVLCFLVAALSLTAPVCRAQDSTLAPATVRPLPWAAGGTLLASGSVMTFVPGAKAWAVDLRDAVQRDGHSRLVADDYLQYLPAVTSPVLNICGLQSKHSLRKMALLEGGSYLLGAAVLNVAKYGFGVQRPDGTAFNSFPSGHTFTAFTGAEVLRREYGEEYPWVAVAGYAVATLVGAMRIYNNRHWVGDVLAGAGLGILSVGVVYTLF